MEDDKVRIPNLETVLVAFRKQSIELTQDLDKIISEKLPQFYENTYRLETSNEDQDDVFFIKEYVEQIKTHNYEQGKGGVYRGYASFPHETIRNILCIKGGKIDVDIISSAFKASCETLLCDNQTITTKCQAIDLIMYLLRHYPELGVKNSQIIENAKSSATQVFNCNTRFSDSNVSDISLKFSYYLLLTSFDQNVSLRLLEVLPYVQNEIPDQLRICKTILHFLENDKNFSIESQLESILLHTILTWIDAESVDVRWYCVKILFLLGRNEALNDIISYQVINLIDHDNVYIKNLIQRSISESKIDCSTKEYVRSKCENDNNYVVRKVYQELNN